MWWDEGTGQVSGSMAHHTSPALRLHRGFLYVRNHLLVSSTTCLNLSRGMTTCIIADQSQRYKASKTGSSAVSFLRAMLSRSIPQFFSSSVD